MWKRLSNLCVDNYFKITIQMLELFVYAIRETALPYKVYRQFQFLFSKIIFLTKLINCVVFYKSICKYIFSLFKYNWHS